MLKKILTFIMFIITASRAIPLFLDIVFLKTNLPIQIIASSLLIVLVGIVFMLKFFIKKLTVKDIALFYGAEFIVVLFNLSYIYFLNPIHINLYQIFIIGNILTLIINPIFVIISLKNKKYTTTIQINDISK